ncbi:hypothetical protein QYE76_017638 [Lolium multiflorum]|uniref:Uncharacterized protein n=1 Tax=Lolium multiflorum TaxID=4521 RepID=A0AAD8Q3D0_LOLMU|nr:hypothetical protein QYE76_017638 [Lolium multiflorum]
MMFQAKDKIAELGKQLAEAQNASTSLATASCELENLRSAYQDLETKLAEADKKQERAEKQLTEKNSELLQKESDLLEPPEPLGFNEERRNQFPRDDLIRLAGDDCRELISACRKICHNLNIKDSRTCDINQLIKRMDMLPELVVELQASSARGAACMSLAMCLARSLVAMIPCSPDSPHRILRQSRAPTDELLEAEYAKEREAEARPVGSAMRAKSPGPAQRTSLRTAPLHRQQREDDDEDEDAVSSPAKEAEGETAQTEDRTGSSPTREK